MSKKLYEKVAFDKINNELIEDLKKPNFEGLSRLAIKNSDGLIMASENLPDSIVNEIKECDKPHLDFSQSKDEETYIEFYNNKL